MSPPSDTARPDDPDPRPAGPSGPGGRQQEFAVDVPEGVEPYTCRHCGMPFATERALALHRGLEHPGALDETERAAFETAREAEIAALRRFRILALGGLVLLYFGLLFAYATFA